MYETRKGLKNDESITDSDILPLRDNKTQTSKEAPTGPAMILQERILDFCDEPTNKTHFQCTAGDRVATPKV